jgi:6-phosphogluconolactonase
VFPLLPDGRLGEHTALVTDTGPTGPNKERQEGPHAHWIGVTPDNRFARVADLGLDAILSYRFDASKGTLADTLATLKTDPGAGPRHFAFHPTNEFAYFLAEMDATVTTLLHDSKNSGLSSIQTISTLPRNYTGPKEGAELVVHPNGRFMYASNRGSADSISAFASNPDKGTLKLVGRFSTKGKTPRHFAIDPSGNFLLAENQFSNNIVTFRIDQKTGALTPTGDTVEVPSPVCLVFLAVE